MSAYEHIYYRDNASIVVNVLFFVKCFIFVCQGPPQNYQQGMVLATIAMATLQTGLVDSGLDWIGDAVSTCGSPEPSSMLGGCIAECSLSYSSRAREI